MNEELFKKVKFELSMIKLREVEIEDIKLRIEDIRLGDSLKAVAYDDMPRGVSSTCKNNDSMLFEAERLENKIKRHEIGNKRINNALKILEADELEVVQWVLIDKVSINKTSLNLGKKRQTIHNIRDKALEKLAYFYQ